MANIICWICNDNLAYQKYDANKLLDDNGDKPCFECMMEDMAKDEEEVDSE